MPNDLILFASYSAAIFLEAAPFLLIGSLLSAVMESVVPDGFFGKKLPKSMPLQLTAGLLGGFLLPTCECGVVPVARRLLSKGAPPATAVAFMLSAPVINPIVLVSTYVAFAGDWTMVLGRVFLVLAPAGVLASAAAAIPPQVLLRPDTEPQHIHCGCSHGCSSLDHHDDHTHVSRWRSIAAHAAAEFVDMARFLVLGAAIASAYKVFAPASIVQAMTASPYLAVAGMMLLAVLLSICSEADAFVAASFQSVERSGQLAFIGIGPMVDLKLIPMFFAVFHRRFATALLIIPIFLVYLFSIIFAFGDTSL